MINFKASNFEGECIVDEEFASLLSEMNIIAKKYNFIIVVISSFRKDTNVKGAIVTPAKMSNHLIGMAIDINLKDKSTGQYYNSKLMGDGKGKDELFLKEVDKTTALTWGMSFTTPDAVHFDNRLNVQYPEKWKQKYKIIHP